MTTPFGKVADHVGSGFFKPLEHMNDLALLVEPKTIAKNVAFTTYDKKPGVRDEVLADVSVFANQADLNAAQPSAILKSVKVTHGMLTSSLSNFLGGAIVVTVSKTSTQNGSGYVFRDVTDTAILEAAGNYYTSRNEAAAAAPSFE